MAYESAQQDTRPVEDWLNDSDRLDPQRDENAIDIWNSVREKSPMATTESDRRAALQKWLRAVPQFRLDPSKQTTWANGRIRSPRNIPGAPRPLSHIHHPPDTIHRHITENRTLSP